jgi:hypothetical protein
MVHIKFTACLRTPVVSPKFVLMASDDAIQISTEWKESPNEQPELSLAGEQAVVSTEVASEQGAGSDREDQSEGSGNSETASDNSGHLKIGAQAALAGMSYDFRQSTVMKACLASLESSAHYFPKGYARPPSVESVQVPSEDEVVVFEDFFIAGLCMPPDPILLDICASFRCSCIN